MTKAKKIKDRLPRISLYPLSPEEAMGLCMQVDPKRILRAERRAKQGKGKN